jgi:glycosyltransferase involved in cell wall biosynthesis
MTPIRTIAVDLVPLIPGGDNGGAKIFTIELISSLAKLKPNTKFILLTQRSSHDELVSLDGPNVSRLMVWDTSGPIVPTPRLSRYRKALLRRLPGFVPNRLLRSLRRLLDPLGQSMTARTGADLLFCPFTAPMFHDPNVPTVSVIYDRQYATYPEFFTTHEIGQRDQNFRDASGYSSAVATISDYVRDSILKTNIISSDRVFTIYIQAPHRLPEPDPQLSRDILQRLGIRNRGYLIYPANFWRHKNHEMLLTSFGIARTAGLGDDIKLVLTGAPSDRMNELKQAAHALGLGKHVRFAGFVVNAEFAALLNNCLAVIFPSLYEGFGMPVVEAMAAGCPVACSNITSLPEVAGDAALLFDPRVPSQIAQAIVRIATDEKLRADLVARGAKQAAKFSNTAHMAEQYWQLFENATTIECTENSLHGVHHDG